MASWERKEISEIHPTDFLPALQKSEIKLVDRNKRFSFRTYFKCLNFAKSKSMTLPTFGWIFKAETKTLMCILMTNTGFQRHYYTFILWQTKSSSSKRSIIQHSTTLPDRVTEFVSLWVPRATEKLCHQKPLIYLFEQSQVLKIELYISYPIRIYSFVEENPTTP